MMDRRTFGLFIFGALQAAQASAQSRTPAGKIGYVHPVTISPNHITHSILRQAWVKLGYVEGQSVLLRSADGDPARLPHAITDLVEQKVGVMIVVGADAVRAAVKTAKATPIVAIDLESDPVRSGLVASYARPGGNVTGLFLDLPVLAGKWIELLREAAPDLERVILLWDPASGPDQLNIAIEVAQTLGLDRRVLEIPKLGDFDRAFESLERRRAGIVYLTSPGLTMTAAAFATVAQKYRLPSISHLRAIAQAGVMMSFGPNQEDYFPRAVDLADKILRGIWVGDIPIERPARFDFTINLKTARALGIAIPLALLASADEVIE
jgi:putative tryptophan/tyrosine transport system substrate-binding protein